VEKKIRARCGRCGMDVLVRANGTLRVHGKETTGEACAMSGAPRLTAHDAPPRPAVSVVAEVPAPGQSAVKPTTAVGGSDKGPWFGAQFPGICEGCGNGFEEGDMIRADGNGGWECEKWCGQDDPAEPACCDGCEGSEEPKNWERPTAANVRIPAQQEPSTALDAAMDFLTGGVEIPEPDSAPARPETDRYGYLIKDPETGEFRRWKNGNVKGITRTTTFNKAASDRTALTDWGKRNVLVGASLRPDLVLKAHGLDVAADKAQLAALVEQLEDAAGAKVSASIGTAIHALTEKIDRGEINLTDVPAAYQGHVLSYLEALEEAGLQVVPDLIEQTIFFPKYGGVAGKFDRVLHHPASDSYFMGDLKTGKTMSYGWDEIECQEYVYATGYNRFGTYVRGDAADGSLDYWEAPKCHVREDMGVVMWLPVQGPEAGRCRLLMTDLKRGKRQAKLCGLVREARANKPKPELWATPVPVRSVSWEEEFSAVRSGEMAAALWRRAKNAGVEEVRLRALVDIARRALCKN